MLFRSEDLYDKQNRSGEADLFVVKHRNGPTRDLTVSAQLHFSRFVDMPAAQNFGNQDFTQARSAE